ncbi:MAG: hypothetical protein KDE45_20870 [Caldilineaceae bacterium]|nr:hypothetical protein [Caldilineaceae bacterium]
MVLIVGIVTVVLMFMGWFGKRPWTESSRKWVSYYAIAMDVNLLVGLLLYFFLSPVTKQVMANFSAAMGGDREFRFFGVEHITMMIIAVVFAHLASVFAKRGTTDVKKFRNAALWDLASLAIVLISIPWWRPFFRMPF